jgi:hypothetical protein
MEKEDKHHFQQTPPEKSDLKGVAKLHFRPSYPEMEHDFTT